MPAGLRTIVDASTVVQIDQDTQGWQLKEKGTISYTNNVPYDELAIGRYATITVTSSTPILLALTGAHAIRHIYRSGTTWKFYVSGTIDFPTPASSTYYVFEPVNTLVDNFGLAVWDGSGNLCFQSGSKPLRIVGVGAGTYEAGKTYAAIVCGFATQNVNEAWEDEETGEPGWTDYGTIKGAAIDGNVVAEADIDMYFIFSVGGFSVGSWNDTHPQILVVDVTGY